MCETTTTKYICAHTPLIVKPCNIGTLKYPKNPELCPRYKNQKWTMTGNCADCAAKKGQQGEGQGKGGPARRISFHKGRKEGGL
jgi:hypothetical protein